MCVRLQEIEEVFREMKLLSEADRREYQPSSDDRRDEIITETRGTTCVLQEAEDA